MDLIADRGRRVSVEEINTSRLLAHARKQAVQRKLDDIMIVDVDAHHYENEHFADILPFMENEVFKQLSQSTRTSTRSPGTFTPQTIGYQDMGGRVTRYPMRGTEQTDDNRYMKVYRAIEERGLVLSFHSGPNWGEPIFKSCNRFLTAHALGFSWYNIVNLSNWVINGMGERFPKLPVVWIESGLAWVPFLMQKLDHEYMLRPSEAPLLKKKPSDYMRDMYYSSQAMEIQDYSAMECTFRMINAETQLLYSSDYPHWDFDLPSTIWDLRFLSEKAKHNILGGTAARLFKLLPRNDKQKQNLQRFGNLVAA